MMYSSVCGIALLLPFLKVGKATISGQVQQPISLSNKEALFDSAFDAFVEATLQEWHVPGLSIAVVENGKIASKGYGLATLPDQNATADTQYFTGSTTKAFTAAAVGLLVHDDEYPEVQWTAPINKFIRTDFVLEDEHATTHTSIEDALSHRTGLPRHDLIYGQPNDTPSSIVQRMQYLPMTAQPRILFQYCNIMFGVITDLLETITGQKMEAILSKNFWKPLGMLSTTFTIPEATKSGDSRLARGYYWDPPISERLSSTKIGKYVPEPYIDILPISGAGATISTVNDYALWLRALLDASDVDHNTNTSSPITYRVFRDLVTPRTIISDSVSVGSSYITPVLYALGWLTARFRDETIVAHSGGLPGFGTEVYILPEKSYGVVTMGNTAETSNIAGAIISARLLQQKLSLEDARDIAVSPLQETLLALSKTTLNPPSARHRQRSNLRPQTLQTKISPLPVSITHFAGLYSHPAYGNINLTVVEPSQTTSPSEKSLHGLFYPRTWPLKIQLSHVTNTVFAAKYLWPHGIGNIVSGKDIVWEEIGDGFAAVFEFGPTGETVETMGIEIEGSMIEMAEKKGEKHWREGMIWFEKM